jgi:hypothetical protein
MTKTDRWLILASYVLLVGVVAFGAWWLQDEAERAQRQRCEVANLEVGLLLVEITRSEEAVDEATEALLTRAVEVTEEICEGTGVDPATVTDGEDVSQ